MEDFRATFRERYPGMDSDRPEGKACCLKPPGKISNRKELDAVFAPLALKRSFEFFSIKELRMVFFYSC